MFVVPAKKALGTNPDELSEKDSRRLSSYQQKKELERRGAVHKKEGWNSSYVRSDAVVDSLAEK